MSCLKEASGCELIGLASSIAIYICQNSSKEESEVLAAFFTALGDNIALCNLSKEDDNSKEKKKGNC